MCMLVWQKKKQKKKKRNGEQKVMKPKEEYGSNMCYKRRRNWYMSLFTPVYLFFYLFFCISISRNPWAGKLTLENKNSWEVGWQRIIVLNFLIYYFKIWSYLLFQFKMKPEMHYGEVDCPVSPPSSFPQEDELHFEIEMIDFSKVKASFLNFKFSSFLFTTVFT